MSPPRAPKNGDIHDHHHPPPKHQTHRPDTSKNKATARSMRTPQSHFKHKKEKSAHHPTLPHHKRQLPTPAPIQPKRSSIRIAIPLQMLTLGVGNACARYPQYSYAPEGHATLESISPIYFLTFLSFPSLDLPSYFFLDPPLPFRHTNRSNLELPNRSIQIPYVHLCRPTPLLKILLFDHYRKN